MSDKLVLITGATGHVGYAVLLEALRKGYNLRVAVRSQAKADIVRKAALAKPYASESQLQFVVVPDITLPGAFDEAVKGVDGILHIASPIPSGNIKDFEADLIVPAVQGTTSILYSALKEPKIKKFVITSSVAIWMLTSLAGNPVGPDSPIDKFDAPYHNISDAYRASKAKSVTALDDFVAKEKPHFGIAKIAPSYVIGRNELETTAEGANSGSNAYALSAPLGKQVSNDTLFSVVHVADVAFLHVAALNTDPKYEGLFAANYPAAGGEFNDANDYVKKHFPEAVKSGLFPANGSTKSVLADVDVSKTEKVFDFKFKSFEEAFVDSAAFYIELSQKSK